MTEDARLTWGLVAVLLVSLVASAAIVSEAELNYAAVAQPGDSHATVDSLERTPDGLSVELTVENALNRPVRVQWVFLAITDGREREGVSVPFKGSAVLASGTDSITVHVAERRLAELDFENGTIRVTGHLTVAAYNDYTFEVPIRTTEEAS